MNDEFEAKPSPKREMTPRALEAHAEHMRRLAAHYMKALEKVILSKGIDAASAIAARALGSNPEAPEQPQPFAWYWFDHLGCLYMTGNDRKPDVPGHAKPLYEHPAPPPPQTHVEAAQPVAYRWRWTDSEAWVLTRDKPDHVARVVEPLFTAPPPQTHVVPAQPVAYRWRWEDSDRWVLKLEKPNEIGKVIEPLFTAPAPEKHLLVLQKLPAAFEVLDTDNGTYLTRSEDRARNSGFEYNGLYRRDSAELEVTPHPDDLAVDRFATAMKDKLAKKRDEGKSGWEDKDECSQLFLSQLLREHVEKGDPVDVGNLAMMLHQREEQIASLLETLQGE